MTEPTQQFTRSCELSSKVARLLQRRLEGAQERFEARVRAASEACASQAVQQPPATPWDLLLQSCRYGIDTFQRTVLTMDTLRQRGNAYLEHERAGMPPVLHFEYETLMDARQFEHPANYALLRILPAEGVTVDPARRPYIIIDPRAGHGAGIGGFKDDSQVGVALRDGHPVYFVSFFPEPEPGQTLLDVLAAEAAFVHKVRELHPDSAKPVIIGNCQGGWAAMMLVSAHPDDTGPVVINGAPMSYWGGAWQEGDADNPMRYSGGLLHEDTGHLGIFVSGKVARKEHAQIVSVLKSIEALPPGLYGMEIEEQTSAGGEVGYEVSFVEKRLEDVVARINRFAREDEKPFEAVKAVSEFNQSAYEVFVQPFVQAMSNEASASAARELHPLRKELAEEFQHLLPDLAVDEMRRIRGEQDIIVAHEPERALETLPALVTAADDRKRLLALLDAVVSDERIKAMPASAARAETLASTQAQLGAARKRRRRAG